jgi:hypothetical protein
MSVRNVPGGLKGGRRLRLKALPPSLSLLSTEKVSLNVSQAYGPSQPVTGIVLPLPISHNLSFQLYQEAKQCIFGYV